MKTFKQLYENPDQIEYNDKTYRWTDHTFTFCWAGNAGQNVDNNFLAGWDEKHYDLVYDNFVHTTWYDDFKELDRTLMTNRSTISKFLQKAYNVKEPRNALRCAGRLWPTPKLISIWKVMRVGKDLIKLTMDKIKKEYDIPIDNRTWQIEVPTTIKKSGWMTLEEFYSGRISNEKFDPSQPGLFDKLEDEEAEKVIHI